MAYFMGDTLVFMSLIYDEEMIQGAEQRTLLFVLCEEVLGLLK